MVPELAAGVRSGAALAGAPSKTSVMRWDVSTFPAAMAAGGRALTSEAEGAWIVMGRSRPAW